MLGLELFILTPSLLSVDNVNAYIVCIHSIWNTWYCSVYYSLYISVYFFSLLLPLMPIMGFGGEVAVEAFLWRSIVLI